MSALEGYLRELRHEYENPVFYKLSTSTGSLPLNDSIGSRVTIEFRGEKACIHCGRKVKKLYQNGYCFPCVTSLAECDLCIVKPHECHFQKGTCRDNEFAMSHCMVPHYVYLAHSSHVKVGLTRKGRQFRRWIDQGASAAILLAEVPDRKTAGELEMEIAQRLSDKTDWRKMLRGIANPDIDDLIEVRQTVIASLPERYRSFVLEEEASVHRFQYPLTGPFEVNVTSLNLDKTAYIEGTLRGIKGQYLMFDHGVLNVKKFAGYHVQMSVL